MSPSNRSLSTAELLPVHAPTLASVLASIATDETLALRRRQDVSSALRTVAKALRRPLDELPASPIELRGRLNGFCPAQERLSERRWRNVLSLLRFALKHAGISRVPGRHRTPMSPEWTVLLGSTEATIREQHGLSRLARYCSLRGIEPQAVDDAVLNQFGSDLAASEVDGSAEAACRRVAVIWNRLAFPRLAGDGGSLLTVPADPRKFTLPWSAFPAVLVGEIDGCLQRMSDPDEFGPRSRTPLQSSSVQTLRWQLRAYLSALVHQGRDLQTLAGLSSVMAIDTIKLGLRFFLNRADGRAATRRTDQAYRIATCLLSVAMQRIPPATECVEEVRALCRRLHPGPGGMTEKNSNRLKQFDDPANVQALLGLPGTLAAQVARCRSPSRSDALKMQVAVAIELLLMVPMRRGNLVRLDMHRHFVRSRRGVVHLAVPAGEVKNKLPIDALLPAETTRLLDCYVERYRPLLTDIPSPWLFPGLEGRFKSLEGMTVQISGAIHKHTGLRMNPHLFRHLAAKLYLDAHPGAYGVVRLVNGHKSVNTTTTFYCGTETASALRHYDRHVLALRGQATTAAMSGGDGQGSHRGARRAPVPTLGVRR